MSSKPQKNESVGGTGATPADAIVITKDMIESAARTMPRGGVWDFLWFGRDNVEAALSSAMVLASGYQEVSTMALGFLCDQVRSGVDFAKAVMCVSSAREAVDFPALLLRTNVEKLTSEAIKLAEFSHRLLERASEPFKERLNALTAGGTEAA